MSLRGLIHHEAVIESEIRQWRMQSRFQTFLDTVKKCLQRFRFPNKLKKVLGRKSSKTPKKKTLEELLSSKLGLLRFRDFLKSEFSEENLDFWIECEVYKHSSCNNKEKMATAIYQKYIAMGAPKEINLDYPTKHETLSGLLNPDKRTFETAQTKIFQLMETDPFQRFISADCKVQDMFDGKNTNIVQSLLTNGHRHSF